MIELLSFTDEFSYQDDYFGNVVVNAEIIEPIGAGKHRVYSAKVLDFLWVPLPEKELKVEINLPNINSKDQISVDDIMEKLAVKVYEAYVDAVIVDLDNNLVDDLQNYDSRNEHHVDKVLDELNKVEHIFYVSYVKEDIYSAFLAEFDMVPSVVDRVNYYMWEGWVISTIEYL